MTRFQAKKQEKIFKAESTSSNYPKVCITENTEKEMHKMTLCNDSVTIVNCKWGMRTLWELTNNFNTIICIVLEGYKNFL